ncbi:MAG: hypothetical protein Fur0042_12600 [Cyanophyceae cyanobacterium]
MDYTPTNSNLIGTVQRGKHTIRRYVLPNQWHLEVDERGIVHRLAGTWHPNHMENVEAVRKAIGWAPFIGSKGATKAIATNFIKLLPHQFTNYQTYTIYVYAKGNPQVDYSSFSTFVQSCSDIYRDSILFPSEAWVQSQLDCVDWVQLLAAME